MARKIDLKGAYNTGALVFSTNASEAVTSDGPSALFNGEDTSLKLVLNNPNAPFTEVFTLTFNTPIPADKIRIKTTHRLVSDFDIQINGDSNTDINVTDSTPTVKKSTVNDFNLKGISSIQYTLNAAFGSLPNTYEFYEIELFILDEADPYEFNDSVLSTKGWNSSRYDGRQLQGSAINKFTKGDTTYGKTPTLQNYTRNIYVGNSIINLSGSVGEGAIDDNTLMNIDGFSYITLNKYITVNKDNTVTNNVLENKEDNSREKIGFYRSFYEDFPIEKNCQIILTNTKINNSLSDRYKIYFNGGQLKRIFEMGTISGGFSTAYAATYNTSSQVFKIGAIAGQVYADFIYHDEKYIREAGFGDSLINPHPSSNQFLTPPFIDFINTLFDYRTNSTYQGDKRLFVSFLETGSRQPIQTIATGSIPIGSNTPLTTNNLAELSTFELQVADPTSIGSGVFFSGSGITILNQEYNVNNSSGKPEIARFGNIMFSRTEDSNPSLLLKLNKSEVFPNGLNDTNFVIIPENIHPFVKDNLTYFLTRAGIDVGGNTSPIVELDNSNFNLL